MFARCSLLRACRVARHFLRWVNYYYLLGNKLEVILLSNTDGQLYTCYITTYITLYHFSHIFCYLPLLNCSHINIICLLCNYSITFPPLLIGFFYRLFYIMVSIMPEQTCKHIFVLLPILSFSMSKCVSGYRHSHGENYCALVLVRELQYAL